MKNLIKTLIMASVLSGIFSIVAYKLQSLANKKLTSCSYLDPVTIDVFAFGLGLFLIIEALIDIFKHKNAFVPQQITRCLRMSFGFSIVVIHILQFIHK